MKKIIVFLVVHACLSCASTENDATANSPALSNQSCQAQPTKKPGLLNPDLPVAWCLQNPVYPIEALKNRVEGYVLSEYTVLESGKIADITILESEPEGVFDEAVIQALKRSFYVPSGKKFKKLTLKNNFVIPPEFRE